MTGILEELGLEPESIIADSRSIDYPINDPNNLQEVLSRLNADRGMCALFARIQAERGDPVSFMRSLRYAHQGQVFPPVEVMAWLADGFAQWVESNGQTRLEDCLGLRKPEKRQASKALDQSKKHMKSEQHMREIFTLIKVFGLKRTEAIKMSLESEWGRGVAESTALRKYDGWKGKSNKVFIATLLGMNDDDRKKILARYPRRAYEQLAKKYDDIARNIPGSEPV